MPPPARSERQSAQNCRTKVNRSEEVRDFYERMPYPAPLTNLDDHRDLYRNPDRRRAEFH